jgi:hypothetical protein
MKGSEAIKKFKERHGPAKKELTSWVKYCNTSFAAIKKSLQDGEKTVPEITAAANLPSADVLWFVNAMRKYGEAVITGDDGGGFKKYSLKDFQHD